jgi:hypothetical protein
MTINNIRTELEEEYETCILRAKQFLVVVMVSEIIKQKREISLQFLPHADFS